MNMLIKVKEERENLNRTQLLSSRAAQHQIRILSHDNPLISSWSVARHLSMHMYVLIVLKLRMLILRPLDNKSQRKYLITYDQQT